MKSYIGMIMVLMCCSWCTPSNYDDDFPPFPPLPNDGTVSSYFKGVYMEENYAGSE